MYIWEFYSENGWQQTPLFGYELNMSLEELIKEAKLCWKTNEFPQRIIKTQHGVSRLVYKIGNEKELVKMRDHGNMRVHYFRADSNEISGHNKNKGVHGKDPRYCKACVSVIVAVIEDGTSCYVGVAMRNPMDHFNRKIGRAIATGRAKKHQEQGVKCDLFHIKEMIEESYNGDRFMLKTKWSGF